MNPQIPQITQRIAIGIALLLTAAALPVEAQVKGLEIQGYGTYGRIDFTAKHSFATVLGKSSGPLVGGGGRIGLPWFGIFVDIGAWKFQRDGERVIRLNGQTYPLGIPVEVAVTPIELTVGYQFRQLHRRVPRLTPYAGAGYSSFKYQETSSFSASGEDANDRFGGYHVLGGAEFKIVKWLGVAGEVAWTSIEDAIGAAGVSKEFGETNLGGRTLRAKVTIGRD